MEPKKNYKCIADGPIAENLSGALVFNVIIGSYMLLNNLAKVIGADRIIQVLWQRTIHLLSHLRNNRISCTLLLWTRIQPGTSKK